MTQASEADFFAFQFAFQWEHHIWSTFKKSYITPPACAAFAVEQTNELLFHFASAVRTDPFAGSHKSLLELGNNFIGGHTAGKQLFQYGFCFSLFGFFCGLFFGSNLFCLCFRKFLYCNLQSGFFAFQLFFQYADVVRQRGDLGFNLFLGCGLFSNNSRILVMLQASPSAQAQRET